MSRVLLILVGSAALLAQNEPQAGQRRAEVEGSGRHDRWAVVLSGDPLAQQVSQRSELHEAWALAAQQQIVRAQAELGAKLEARGIRRLGATQILLNAVFVAAGAEEAAELARLPGVAGVLRMPAVRRTANRAIGLVNAQNAWANLGGESRAGAGVKIGIIDTGIDHTHPAFQDPGLSVPSGYPACRAAAGECSYTNSKVIAARSYVELLVLGDQPAYSRPDDTSPRDRVGHGTAVAALAAGNFHDTPLGRASGAAPKAYLGNYKVFGSPGVNDVTFGDVVLLALDEAVRDGMDIVTMSLSFAAMWGPLDFGATCSNASGQACDIWAAAVETVVQGSATRLGMTVVAAAGNEGDSGQLAPTLNSIRSPGTAPSAITVGASTNSHRVFNSLRVGGSGVPAVLLRVNGLLGDGPRPAAALAAPLRDVATLANDGRACAALGNNTLTSAIALVQASGCSLRTKVANAQSAGAVAVLFMRSEGNNFVYAPTGLAFTGIPLLLIGHSDGQALRTFLAANPNRQVTIDPALVEDQDPQKYADFIAYFSSSGPAIRTNQIKPELVAPGTDMLVATQRFDPNGDMFSSTGFSVVQGTSFSVPLVAGAAALVKQQNPAWSTDRLKSAVVNTADPAVDDYDNSGRVVPAAVTAMGAGKLNAAGAVRVNVTAAPATVSFGARTNATFAAQALALRNPTSAAVTLSIRVEPGPVTNGRVTVTPSNFSLAAGATSSNVAVRVEGATSTAGIYDGFLIVEGSNVATLRIPYLYIIGDGVPQNLVPLRNFNFEGEVSRRLAGGLSFKVIDRFGVPVNNQAVRFVSVSGGGQIVEATRTTDDLGIAEAYNVVLGPQLGEQVFRAEVGNLPALEFIGNVRLRPVIENNGVVNAASGRAGPLAPGSYITIFGRGLADIFLAYNTSFLPVSLAGVSVSFDVPSRRLSLPGRLHFVSDRQINVQVPWELAGLPSVEMKVSIGDSSSALYTVPLAGVSPAPFQYREAASGRDLVVAQDAAYQLIGSANAARRGGAMILYANGLGPLDNMPASGEVTALAPLASTRNAVTVTVGGRNANVLFSGLTPGTVGLYQINLEVPADAPTGLQPVVVTVAGVSSPAVQVPVQ
jgi:uncharacterized protein (TIGR03437 family)